MAAGELVPVAAGGALWERGEQRSDQGYQVRLPAAAAGWAGSSRTTGTV